MKTFSWISISVILALATRFLLIGTYKVPSYSMSPSLVAGDYIMVSKMAYGLRFPWSTNKQEFMTLPKRGDLIVLNFKKKESTPYVKRIIALPGETVSIAAGKLFINGKACGYEAIDETIYLETCLGSTQRLELMAESNTANDFPETKIKEDEYFVLNDSRENTEDSRSFGMAPADQITGKVSLILYSYGTTQDFISENKSVRWNRILTIP